MNEFLPKPASRRRFITHGVAGVLGLVLRDALRGDESCQPIPGGQTCDALIPSREFAHVRALQETLFWCWAACLEMVFRWHGRPITQESIVGQTFGQPLALPADPLVLINAINRDYVGSSGDRFGVSSRSWSVDFGIAGVDNETMIRSLADRRPLIVCNLTHMMVLVGVNYSRAFNGHVRVNEAWVVDPMLAYSVTQGMGPRALPAGFRYLRFEEFVPIFAGGQLRFVAEISVS